MASITRNFIVTVQGDQAVQELKQIEKAADDTTVSFRELESATNLSTKNLDAKQRMLKGKAVPAMNEFSRVIQDMPYGMQGVANNIQQMTVQFGC